MFGSWPMETSEARALGMVASVLSVLGCRPQAQLRTLHVVRTAHSMGHAGRSTGIRTAVRGRLPSSQRETPPSMM